VLRPWKGGGVSPLVSGRMAGAFALPSPSIYDSLPLMPAPASLPDLRRWLNRATFGITPTLLAEVERTGWESWVTTQLAPDEQADTDCLKRLKNLRLHIEYETQPMATTAAAGAKPMMAATAPKKVNENRPLRLLDQPLENTFSMYGKDVDYAEKNRAMEEVMMASLLRSVHSQWQLREMLVEFWHNHFSVNAEKDESVLLALPAYDRDVIRANALGNFRTMLRGVAQSAAMLYYLDGVESRASPANENFARELFELHTFGARNYLNHLHTKWREVPGALEGKPTGYIDQDVYEAARAFTGWTVENGNEDDDGAKRPNTGKFMVREAWHDPYQKRVLGTEFDSQRPALEDGMRVIDLVSRHPATARFIAEKLCRRFVSDTPPESLVTKVAAEFTAALDAPDQIARVMKVILLSAEYRGAPATKFKRPLEFLASYLRATGADFAPRMDVIYQLDEMGQRLFRWPTPTGHPDTAAYWQSGTFLLRRWNLPLVLRDDSWKGIASFHFLTLTPADCTTAGQVLSFWSQRLLGQEVSEKSRAVLLQILTDDDDAKADSEFNGDDKDRDIRIASCVALLAASPEFQYR
jgi:uncharacterized protein (DUF1800 family)